MDAWGASRGESLHTQTFLGNPLGCAMAVAALRELRRLDAPSLAQRKGAALHGMDRWAEAITAYETGLKLEPDSPTLKIMIEDAKKRHLLAGGDWKFIGNKQVTDPDGEQNPYLGQPTHLCPGPPGYFCIYDHKRSFVRVINM